MTTVYCDAQCTLNVVPAAAPLPLTVREIGPVEAEEFNEDVDDDSDDDSDDVSDDGSDDATGGDDDASSSTAPDLAGSDGGVFFVGDGIGSDFFALTTFSFKSAALVVGGAVE